MQGYDWVAQPGMSTTARVQALAPPVGSVELRMMPPPPATHSETDGHDTTETPGSTGVLVHALALPVGSVEVKMSPSESTATQSETDGQDKDPRRKPPAGSTLAFVHVLAPPVGSVELKMLPSESPATHSETDGHETAAR